MIYIRDGLSFSNENSTLGDALARYLARRKERKAKASEEGKRVARLVKGRSKPA